MEPNNNSFPIEIWWQIFSFLSIANLNKVSLLSKYFRLISQEPELWRKAKIKREKLESEGVEEFLKLVRFKQVEELDLSYIDLTKLRIPVLVTVCQRFRKLRFKYTVLTNIQKEVLLSKAQQSKVLKDLDLDSISLKDVKLDSISKISTGKDSLSLRNTSLSHQHINNFLVNSRLGFLTNLNLSCLNLSEISLHLLIPILSTLKTLQLDNTDLTPDQISCILSQCLWSTSIESLDLSTLNLLDIECQLLIDSLSCLTSIKFSNCRFSRKQLTSILYSITLDHSTLENLDLSTVDLTSLPSNLMARSLPRLTKLNLNHTRASTEQLTALLRSSFKSETLQFLDLANLNLAQVPANLLVKIAHKLEELNLNFCKLTTEQTVAVVEAASSSRTLKHLDMVKSDLRKVPSGILKRAAHRLEHFNTNIVTKSIQQLVT